MLRLLLVAALLVPCGVRAEGRLLTLAVAASAGVQYDARPCTLAGREGLSPDVPVCLLFAGGADAALLWRGRIGGALGLYSSAGQAVKTGQQPAIPDRISLPVLLEVRPLSYLPAAEEETLRGRFLSGLALRAGPSVEIVRTSSDAAAGPGFHMALVGEVPLSASRQHAVSLRLALHLLIVPLLSLNDDAVRSAPVAGCAPSPECMLAADRIHGYGAVAQTYLGLVYYP
ncbi:MAG: hypothetical protein RMK29_10385 [Myxococcales bacterium]|nr:hypothetical protein [Myxococcota bacterium]MDW8282110.1 hypothetical protein [Myxococcales bacterium]